MSAEDARATREGGRHDSHTSRRLVDPAACGLQRCVLVAWTDGAVSSAGRESTVTTKIVVRRRNWGWPVSPPGGTRY